MDCRWGTGELLKVATLKPCYLIPFDADNVIMDQSQYSIKMITTTIAIAY